MRLLAVIVGTIVAAAIIVCAHGPSESEEAVLESFGDHKLLAWERQLENKTLPGWPVEHEELLLVQLVTNRLVAFRKVDGVKIWWLPVGCPILPGAGASRPHKVLVFACIEQVFAVPMDIHGKFHHKKKHLENEKLWAKPPPENNTFLAHPLVRGKAAVMVASEGHVVSYDLLSGETNFKTTVPVCPAEPGSPLPLYVATVFDEPLVACVVLEDGTKSVVTINGEHGGVEERFPGPVVPLPTRKPTAAPHHQDAELEIRSQPSGATKKDTPKDVIWAPIVDRHRPMLDLHVAEDEEDGDDDKLHHTRVVWALVSTNLHPPRIVLASLLLQDVITPTPKPETPRPHEANSAVIGLGLGKPRRRKEEKKVEASAEYQFLDARLSIARIDQGSHSIKRSFFAKTHFFLTTHCGESATGCLTASLYDATDLRSGSKVDIALPTLVVLTPGGKQPLGPPQQMTSDTARLLIQQKIETSNASLPQALISGFLFDPIKNSSQATFSLPVRLDVDEGMNINTNIAAIPLPNGVSFINATSGVPEKHLPLLPTKTLPSDIISDSDRFYFAAGEFLYGIPRLLV